MSSSNLKFIGFEEDFNETYNFEDSLLLGTGGSGKVFKVKNKKDKKDYAIKIFTGVETIEEFMLNLNEVFGLLRIGIVNNQYVINMHQIFVWTEKSTKMKVNQMVLAIVMDYCNGGSLKDLIKEARKNNNKELEEIFLEKLTKELISGFDKLITDSKLHHRDIKPDNILFKDGKVKICDFDVCKLLSSAKTLRV